MGERWPFYPPARLGSRELKAVVELSAQAAPLRPMSIEDRDYMRPPAQPKAATIFGLAVWKFILCVVVLVGVGVWKFGVIGKLFPSGPVNVNTATMEQLIALPDVDEKIAADIVSKRPFATVEDLLKVKGIGEKRLGKLRDKVVVVPPAK